MNTIELRGLAGVPFSRNGGEMTGTIERASHLAAISDACELASARSEEGEP